MSSHLAGKVSLVKCTYWGSLALLLSLLVTVLHPSWSRHSYYDYGWVVIPLTLWFLIRRWQRPVERFNPSRSPRWLLLTSVALSLSLLVLHAVHQVDLYWRQPLWLIAGVSLLLFYSVVSAVEGKQRALTLLPAGLFLLTAVPLPTVLETSLVQGLTALVVEVSHFLLLLGGILVERTGNLLNANGTPVDVADGCSGIRSLQSTLMAAFALGELFAAGMAVRIILPVAAVAIAFIGNSLRIIALGWIAAKDGLEAVEAAHDPLGFATATFVYGVLALVAWPLSSDRLSSRRRRIIRTEGGTK